MLPVTLQGRGTDREEAFPYLIESRLPRHQMASTEHRAQKQFAWQKTSINDISKA